MKVWRNSEGREFPLVLDAAGAWVGDEVLSSGAMRSLGYELVEKEEPEVAPVSAPEGIICELRVGIAKDGPYFSLTNHNEQEVSLTIYPHQVEAIWRPMC